ncbi:hypothetical protein COB52_01260 [Candidatus Kaiserbacteria bacterium]|nr:MAG: hypothetical protein COB52_01260 [Candidatus Kaiserbacteria bacterium]
MKRGFTLIELIVVMGIMMIITSILLVNYNKFGGQVLLRNLAYEVALSVREAQVFGISSRAFQGGFSTGHGVYFDLGSSTNSFSLYSDADGNSFFNSASTEWVKTSTLGRGYSIDRICVSSGGSESCNIIELDILFKRPEPDAIIRASTGGSFTSYSSARIVLVSPQEKKRSVLIESAGQISVQRYDE